MLHLIVGHPHGAHPSHAQGQFHGGPGLSTRFAARVVVGRLALRAPRDAVALRLDGEGEMDQDLTKTQGIQNDSDGLTLWFHQTWLEIPELNGGFIRKIIDFHGPFSSQPCLIT